MAKEMTQDMMGEEVRISGAEQEVMDKVSYRTLYIGLGGTGGHVLNSLRRKMTTEEAENARMIYLDTDANDVRKIKAMGVPAVHLGSSDSVRDVISYLGADDGVLDWIANGENDAQFLSSPTDVGASQFRFKSRLCMAKLLKQKNNDLEKLLNELCPPGAKLKEKLRVMIVSSIAGGTGAGTFIQVALYLREYFRSHNHKDIRITGVLACPDLFLTSGIVGVEEANVYANAYAVARELNAMNLVVATGATKDGYGKSINIAIDTKSEGTLFDSKSHLFAKAGNTNYKPFDLLYFVDQANTEGGILSTIEQYYDMMADVVHTRLYSPMEASISSIEDNELGKHVNYPTAIYGSAGYSRIRYPYYGIITYLAVRKTKEELDHTWSLMENSWAQYVRNKTIDAKAQGRRWRPSSDERGRCYIADMDRYLENKASRVNDLRRAVKGTSASEDRAATFLRVLKQETSMQGQAVGIANKHDGCYSLTQDKNVSNYRAMLLDTKQTLQETLNEARSAKGAAKGAELVKTVKRENQWVEENLTQYISAITAATSFAAMRASSDIAPRTAEAVTEEAQKSPVNLYSNLLCADGKAVHPLAARYLLYRLRELLQKELKHESRTTYDDHLKALRTCLDSNPNDNIEISVDKYLEEVSDELRFYRFSKARQTLETYSSMFTEVLSRIEDNATRSLQREVFKSVLEVVNELIKQYEGLFDNLKQYKVSLQENLERQSDAHERSSDDRCIFINASRRDKAYYYERDERTVGILEDGSEDIASAAGKGIYEALMTRTWKTLRTQEVDNMLGAQEQKSPPKEVDTYADLGSIFENVIEEYSKYLFEKAEHLNMDVITAMIQACCRNIKLTEADLIDKVKFARMRNEFDALILDAKSKAKPMLNYNANNTDPYFEEEAKDPVVNVSIEYTHMGISRQASEALNRLFDADTTREAINLFGSEYEISKGLSVNTNYSDYDLVCFSAVHCLQPTQIRKFREEYSRGYYPRYKERISAINSGKQALCTTPHLDKRWHLREAMPYISRSMDIEWYKKTAKAFIYELLERNLCFTKDSKGVTCFRYMPNGNSKGILVNWPGNQRVTVTDISRLMEFLQEDIDRVEEANLLLDKKIQDMVDLLSDYTDQAAVYKGLITKDRTMKEMRGNLLIRKDQLTTATLGHGKNASRRKGLSNDEAAAIKKAYAAEGFGDLDVVDLDQTMGGLLEVAYLVHRSEEKQKRDHDYGEYIVAAALEIIEKLSAGMYGDNLKEESDEYAAYVDLYNSIQEKFVEALVVSLMRRLKMVDYKPYMPKKDADDKKQTKQTKQTKQKKQKDEDEQKNVRIQYYRYLDIPEKITETPEYVWAAPLLKLK